MIFYPIRWRGLPIFRVEGEPLGLIGWQGESIRFVYLIGGKEHDESNTQRYSFFLHISFHNIIDIVSPRLLLHTGIIPAKTLKMSEAMVNTTINELLTMEEIIQRLDPDTVADILQPKAGQIVQPFIDVFLADKPRAIFDLASNYTMDTGGWVQQRAAHKFLRDLTVDVQKNIGSICNLRNCVVNMMMADRSLLGKLFQISGKDELIFLVDSGLWFGFILGMIQLTVMLYWSNPWVNSVGGLIVGLATNWLALKWIFEPVNPLRLGPVTLQGLFLRRQNEVSADFSKFFANEVLTSRQLFKSMLTDPSTLPEWEKLIARRFSSFASDVTLGTLDLRGENPRKLNAASARLCANLYDYLAGLHDYVDDALEIERTLRARMMAMTSAQFERVLHPIFEEDELTLILSGGGLGFMAGLVQQLLSTGSLSIRLPRLSLGGNTNVVTLVGSVLGMYVISVAIKPSKRMVLFVNRLIDRTRRLKKKTSRYLNRRTIKPA